MIPSPVNISCQSRLMNRPCLFYHPTLVECFFTHQNRLVSSTNIFSFCNSPQVSTRIDYCCVTIRHFHQHTLGNNTNFVFLHICSFLHYLDLKMLVNDKLDDSGQKGLPFKVEDFIGLLYFKWHSPIEVGNIGILILPRYHGNFS